MRLSRLAAYGCVSSAPRGGLRHRGASNPVSTDGDHLLWQVITTSPTVPNKVKLKDGTEMVVSSAAAFPDPALIAEMFEPMVKATIVTPSDYLGGLIGLLEDRRGTQVWPSKSLNALLLNV